MLRNPDRPLSSWMAQVMAPPADAPATVGPDEDAQAAEVVEDWIYCAPSAPVAPPPSTTLVAPPPPPPPGQGREAQGGTGALSYTAPAPGPALTPELLPQGDTRLYKPRKGETQRQRALAVIAELDQQVRERATRVAMAYMGSAEIDDDSPRPEGWSDRDYRVAKDGRLPAKTQPGYLQAAVRIAESYKRAESKEPPPAPALAVDVKVWVKSESFNYPVLDVDKDS